MGNLVFQATLGGQVNLVGPNTASTYNLNVPAVAGTLVTTGDTGSVTNTMLAGSIANAKLFNSSVTIGATSVALGATAASLSGLTDVSTSTLTASSTVTISGGTANGVGYLNGSKVLTTGSGLVFDGTNLGIGTATPNNYSGYKTLTINGTATTGGGEIDFSDGGTTRGSVFSTNTGFTISSYSSVPLLFALNGSEQMRLTSTGLGIGTSSPATKLHVTAGAAGVQALFSYSSGTPTIAIGNSATNYNTQIGYNVTSEYGYIQATAATGVADDIVINPNGGNLGVGTVSPNASAIIDAQSTTKGVRFPNMTGTQKNAISSPPAGLVVFDTTLAKLCVYSGSAWQTITSI